MDIPFEWWALVLILAAAVAFFIYVATPPRGGVGQGGVGADPSGSRHGVPPADSTEALRRTEDDSRTASDSGHGHHAHDHHSHSSSHGSHDHSGWGSSSNSSSSSSSSGSSGGG